MGGDGGGAAGHQCLSAYSIDFGRLHSNRQILNLRFDDEKERRWKVATGGEGGGMAWRDKSSSSDSMRRRRDGGGSRRAE